MVAMLYPRKIRSESRSIIDSQRSIIIRTKKSGPSLSSPNIVDDLHSSKTELLHGRNNHQGNRFLFQRTALVRFSQYIETNDEMDERCKTVLDKLLLVHTLKFLEENFNLLFEGNYLNNGSASLWMQNRLIDLCHELRNEAATLVDVFAPPDHILNSVLGVSDGKVRCKNCRSTKLICLLVGLRSDQ